MTNSLIYLGTKCVGETQPEEIADKFLIKKIEQ